MPVDPPILLSDFSEAISILTVANFALGFETVREYVGEDWKDRTSQLANPLFDRMELIKANWGTPDGVDEIKLSEILVQFSKTYEDIVVRQGKAEKVLKNIQKNCFYVLSLFGMVLLILGAYERLVGYGQVNITLFHLSTLVILAIGVLIGWKSFVPLPDSQVRSVVMQGYIVVGIFLFSTNGGVEACTEHMRNPLCSIPYACFVLSLGFVVFIAQSMVGKKYYKASMRAYGHAIRQMDEIDKSIEIIERLRKRGSPKK